MQIKVLRERCCGSGNCVTTAPDIFDQDTNVGLVQLRVQELAPAQVEQARLAADECPTAAIEISS